MWIREKWRKPFGIGLRCYIMTFLAFGLLEVRDLFVYSKKIYLIITRKLGLLEKNISSVTQIRLA